MATRMIAGVEQKMQASSVARRLSLPKRINKLRAGTKIVLQSVALQDYVGSVRYRMQIDRSSALRPARLAKLGLSIRCASPMKTAAPKAHDRLTLTADFSPAVDQTACGCIGFSFVARLAQDVAILMGDDPGEFV